MKDESSTDNSFPNKDLEDAIDAIKADTPATSEIAGASERVRNAIAAQRGPQAVSIQDAGSVSAEDSWNSIEDYIAAIPAYLANQLSQSQTLLFEEETRQSLPLRRALNEAKGSSSDQSFTNAGTESSVKNPVRWLAAAAAVAVVAVALVLIMPELPSFNQTRLAQIDEIDGDLYQIVNGRLETLTPGSWIDGRQRIRSAQDSSAIITLDDGSQIEVDERSEISMTRRGSGNRIDVSRGRILVVASPQGSGTLDVFTDEFMVSVTGTIFEVAHGAKGSRVSVIEGEVDVLLQGSTTSLTPGEALASRMDFLTLNVSDEISWSRDADLYIAMLQEAAALQQDLQAVMATTPRYSTRLLDLAPEQTAVYIAVPNAPEKIAEVYDVIQTRAESSELLAQAWTDLESASGGQYLDDIMSWLREIGYALGEETVLAITMESAGDEPLSVPVILSEVDADAFAATFEQYLEQLQQVLAAEGNEGELEIALIDHPSEAIDGQLSVWLYEDILVATIDAIVMQEMQTIVENQGSAFVGSELHAMLQASYSQGTEMLGAVNIQQLLMPIDTSDEGLEEAGLANAEYLIAQHQQDSGTTTITADLFFDGVTQGVMSWLSPPGPMGSLEFFSVDSTFAAAMLLRDPDAIVEELGPIELSDDVDAAAELELFYNVVSTLGGELAIGLDGPALPTPAWKAVVEAYDATVLQESIEWSIASFNDYSAENKVGATISLSEANIAGYDGYHVNLTVDDSMAVGDWNSAAFNYAYVDGYLVAAPDEALVDRAISFYESGSGLQTDSEFRELLSRDGYLDFSAVYFSRLGELVSSVVQSLPSDLTEEQQAAVSALDTEVGPSMTSLLALPDKIHFAHSGSTKLPLQILSQLVILQPALQSFADQAQVQ